MTELRQFHRAPCAHLIELVHQGCSHRGCLDNISQNGALVRLDQVPEIAAGELCLLRMELEEGPPLQIRTEAIHGSANLVGVRFLWSEEEARPQLSLLTKLIGKAPGREEEDLERIRAYLADYCSRR